MNNIEIAIELLREANDELIRLNDYTNRCDEIYVLDSDEYTHAVRELRANYPIEPKKSIINDNIKMARRLLLKEYV